MKSNAILANDVTSDIYTPGQISEEANNGHVVMNNVSLVDRGLEYEAEQEEILILEDRTDADITSHLKAFKLVASNYIPTAFSRIINMFNGPASTLILSHYNADLLAVSSLASAGQLLVVTIPSMMIYGTSPIIGRICGAANEGDDSNKDAGIITQSSWVYSLALSVPIMITVSYSENILLALGQDPENVSLVQEYFNAYRWGVPALLCMISTQQLAAGLKKPLIVFSSTAINAVMSNALGYLFVNGKMNGFSKGIQGMGCANAISNWATLAGLLLYYRSNNEFEKYRLFSLNEVKSVLQGILKFLRVGGPLMLIVGAEISTIACISLLSGRYGNEQLSAHQVASQLFTLYLGMSVGMTQTSSALISHEHGAKNLNNVKMLSSATLLVSLATSIIMAPTFASLSKNISSIFLPPDQGAMNQSIIDTSKNLILIDAIGQPADFLRNCSVGILRGRGSNWKPMIINLLLFCSMTFSFSYISDIKEDKGLYIGRTIGMYLAAVALLLLVYKKNQSITVEHTNTTSSISNLLKCNGLFSRCLNKNKNDKGNTAITNSAEDLEREYHSLNA